MSGCPVLEQLHVHAGEIAADHGGDDHAVAEAVEEGHGGALPAAQVLVGVEADDAHAGERAVDADVVVAGHQGEVLEGHAHVGQLVVDGGHVLDDVHRCPASP